MRNITFPEFCQIVEDAYAVVLDHNALSYPYVVQEEDEDGNIVYDRIEINYADDYEQIEHSFYSDECEHIAINDEGEIDLIANDESYAIQVLTIKKLV